MKTYLYRILIPLLFTVSWCNAQHPILWGTTSGGQFQQNGSIFYYNTATGNETTVHIFEDFTGTSPSASLIQASNGLLYGTAGEEGTSNGGTLFSYNINKGAFSALHYFGIDTDGSNPLGSLIQGTNGLLYGTTSSGGSVDFSGIIFSFDISSTSENVIYDFGTSANFDGATPGGALIQAGNGLLYGMTEAGGTQGLGVIFRYNVAGNTYKVIHEFGDNTDGQSPQGSLIQASDSLLYGMTGFGGDSSGGVIFSYNITTGGYLILHDFGSGTDGKYPGGSLIQASNGLLYGLTSSGGVYNQGIIFSYNISTGEYAGLHDFGSSGTDGIGPLGSLMQASDGLLYGMTYEGGAIDTAAVGTIFSYNISTGAENVIFSFNGVDGAYPEGGLIEVDFPTNINSVFSENQQLQIVPNPSSGQFTIQLPNGQSNFPVEIYNMLGEKIYESVLSNGSNIVDLSRHAVGMYLIYLHADEEVKTGKVMIAR